MALKDAVKVGGDYLDLVDLAEDGPVTVIFRLKEFLPEERGDFGPLVPVIADAVICSGPRKGEVWLAEKFFGAPTSTLRGVRNPTREKPEVIPPENEVGDEIITRVEAIKKGKQPTFAGLNVPSDADKREALEVYADGACWSGAMAGSGSRPF